MNSVTSLISVLVFSATLLQTAWAETTKAPLQCYFCEGDAETCKGDNLDNHVANCTAEAKSCFTVIYKVSKKERGLIHYDHDPLKVYLEEFVTWYGRGCALEDYDNYCYIHSTEEVCHCNTDLCNSSPPIYGSTTLMAVLIFLLHFFCKL